MAYIFKQKLRVSDLAHISPNRKKVLIYEPEEYLSALYGSYLRIHKFAVEHCANLDALPKTLTEFSPHLLIFNTDSPGNSLSSKSWLMAAKKYYPELIIVTTNINLSHEGVRELMSAGISSHINRSLSRPQDIVVIVKSLLYT